ncbi:MAG: hypothetical protein IKZ98_13680 [Clostridia bacterium]|nr:hypothetical protein [Clostridia bacterium]
MNSIRKAISLIISLVLILGCTCAFSEGEEWTCPDCGAANTTNFCIKCGAKKPEAIICPNCGAEYSFDSGVVYCGNCGTKLQQSIISAVKYEGDGFDTPEEALACYMEGLKNLNFEQMMSAFAWETQVEHYDLQVYLERIGAYQPTMYPRMPSVNDFMFSANVNTVRFMQAVLIYRAVEAYILGDDAPAKAASGLIVFQKDSNDVEEFLKKFENGRLEKLTQMTNIRFLSPDEITDNKFSNEMNAKNFVKQTACYGADETVNLVGVANAGDETLYCWPTICRYGDKWYLVSLSSLTSMIIGVSNNNLAFVCGTGSLSDMIR